MTDPGPTSGRGPRRPAVSPPPSRVRPHELQRTSGVPRRRVESARPPYQYHPDCRRQIIRSSAGPMQILRACCTLLALPLAAHGQVGGIEADEPASPPGFAATSVRTSTQLGSDRFRRRMEGEGPTTAAGFTNVRGLMRSGTNLMQVSRRPRPCPPSIPTVSPPLSPSPPLPPTTTTVAHTHTRQLRPGNHA